MHFIIIFVIFVCFVIIIIFVIFILAKDILRDAFPYQNCSL